MCGRRCRCAVGGDSLNGPRTAFRDEKVYGLVGSRAVINRKALLAS
jgi:hypothetical protein